MSGYGTYQQSGNVWEWCGDWYEGETVAERLKRAGPLPLAEAVAVVRQAADALDHAHEALVFHRDVKPANIKLAPDPGLG